VDGRVQQVQQGDEAGQRLVEMPSRKQKQRDGGAADQHRLQDQQRLSSLRQGIKRRDDEREQRRVKTEVRAHRPHQRRALHELAAVDQVPDDVVFQRQVVAGADPPVPGAGVVAEIRRVAERPEAHQQQRQRSGEPGPADARRRFGPGQLPPQGCLARARPRGDGHAQGRLEREHGQRDQHQEGEAAVFPCLPAKQQGDEPGGGQRRQPASDVAENDRHSRLVSRPPDEQGAQAGRHGDATKPHHQQEMTDAPADDVADEIGVGVPLDEQEAQRQPHRQPLGRQQHQRLRQDRGARGGCRPIRRWRRQAVSRHLARENDVVRAGCKRR